MDAAAASVEQRLASGRVEYLRGHQRKITCLAWNRSGSVLASGSNDGTVRLWQMEPGGASRGSVALKPAGAAGPVFIDALAWSPEDPNLLASAGSDRCIRFWDARQGRAECAVQLKGGNVLFMAWHPLGHVLAVGTSDDTLYLVDARRSAVDARKVAVLSAAQQQWEMNELAWTPSGLLFISAGPKTHMETFEGMVVIAAPKEGYAGTVEVARLKAHTGQIQSLKFDRSFRHFATSSTDSTVAIWSLEDLAVLRTFDRLEYAAKSLSFSHDGALLATASDDKIVDVVRVADGTRVRAIPCSGLTSHVVAWAPHAHILAWACEDVDKAQQHAGYGPPPPPEHGSVRILAV